MAQVKTGPASRLWELGYVDLVSVEKGGKRPAIWALGQWKGYSWNCPQTESFVETMDRHGANVGLRAGFFPGIDIDTDDPTATVFAYNLAVELLGPAPIRLSSGARRLLVYRTDEPFKKKVLSFGDQAVEVLGDGQQYVVYGTHPSGDKYHFQKGHTLPRSPDLLTRVTEEEVIEYLAQLGALLDENGYGTAISGVGPTGAAEPVADEVSAGARNDTLASMAGSLRRRNFPEESALAALVSANAEICQPPLDFEEVALIVSSIYDNYEAGEELVRIPATEEFEVEEVPAEPKKRPAFKRVKAGELVSQEIPAEVWLVPDMIPIDGTSLLVAKPKVGKSTLSRGLAVAIAKGRPFLDREVKQAPVMYVMFPNEGTEREAQSEWARLGIEPDDPADLWFYYDKDWRIDKPEVIEYLSREARRIKPALIVIDTLQGLVQASDLNDYAKVHKALEPIRAMVEDGGHLMYVHHAGKSERIDMMDCSLGSQALAGSVEVVLVMARDPDEQQIRYLATRGRGVEMDAHILGVDEVTHEPVLGPSTEKFKADTLSLKIVAALNELGEPVRQEDLRSYLEVKRGPLTRALKMLEESGSITVTGKGVRGDPKLFTTPDATTEFEVEE